MTIFHRTGSYTVSHRTYSGTDVDYYQTMYPELVEGIKSFLDGMADDTDWKLLCFMETAETLTNCDIKPFTSLLLSLQVEVSNAE